MSERAEASQTCFVVGPRALGSGARGVGACRRRGRASRERGGASEGSGGERCSSAEDGRAWYGYAAWLCGPAELVQTRRRNIRIPVPIHYPPIAAMNSRACVGAGGLNPSSARDRTACNLCAQWGVRRGGRGKHGVGVGARCVLGTRQRLRGSVVWLLALFLASMRVGGTVKLPRHANGQVRSWYSGFPARRVARRSLARSLAIAIKGAALSGSDHPPVDQRLGRERRGAANSSLSTSTRHTRHNAGCSIQT